MGGIEGRDPYEDYCTINEELGQYQYRLLERPQIVVANKMDEENAEENLKALYQLQNKGFIVVFASGRSYNDIKINLLEKYHLQIPVIALNGLKSIYKMVSYLQICLLKKTRFLILSINVIN